MASEYTQVRVSKQIHEQLAAWAEARGLSQREAVEEAIQIWVAGGPALRLITSVNQILQMLPALDAVDIKLKDLSEDMLEQESPTVDLGDWLSGNVKGEMEAEANFKDGTTVRKEAGKEMEVED